MQACCVQAFLSDRRRFAFGVFVGIALAGFAWLVLRPHEPSFQGRPLSVWLHKVYPTGAYYLELPSPEAADALSSIGTDALPTLLRMAGAPNTMGRRVLEQFASEYPFLHLPLAVEDNELAVWGFKVLGPRARPAVPALARLLNDADPLVQLNAARALGGIGRGASEAVPALVMALQKPVAAQWQSIPFREAVAAALGEIGPAALPALPQLAALTNVLSAELAMAKLKGESLVPFIDRLKNTSDQRQWGRTARMVAELGTNAEPAVPLLLSALNSTNSLQEQALYALARIQRRPDLCVPKMLPLLSSPNPNVRFQALVVLGAFGAEAKAAVPQITRLITNPGGWLWVSWKATNTLNMIDPAAAARVAFKPD